MNAVFDIAIDGNEDVVVTAAGDFDIIEATGQHQTRLVLDNKGDYKQNPAVCVGAGDYEDDDRKNEFLQEIAAQFAADGQKVGSVLMGADGIIRTVAGY